MYGREARGPLSFLKSSWWSEISLPLNLSNLAVDYLQEFKINLERVADIESLTTAKKQNSYTHYFNHGKRMKEFKKGDLVYLLIPESINKLYARWTGQGEIIDKPEADNQIPGLDSLGLIELSEAEIAYPVVCVAKKDGSMHLCIDFQLLNVVTKPFDYPMENLTDLINQIGHANIITCLDVLKGYWEIPSEEDSRDFTSFKAHRAQYRWKVMPLGLRNATPSFQKVMNSALSEYHEF
ncbi:Transposon Ty3-I Gag-Pol polyprotein [Araneus ventricosus]|uniref:Transposon Ty3-I Gag-Pol polyprotein n=1 Tax=Araneus ventricosus TaxID=182803 RepID=A0A4Y2AC48_ARAVE|nr:Transposon Ty3-I Gag-Pol polyprotein [Araneus ventricosus]